MTLGEDRFGELTSGQVVERYTVESLIGRGGMGSVYRVRHNRLGSIHALKVLQYASSAERSRLIREGRAQSGLRHPNVVAVTDVVDVNGAPGLILEYVDGPSLDEWLREHGRPSIEQADALAVGLIRGLSAAHEARLVHRDLKPASILLARGEEGLVPKIADFGLARFLGGQSAESHLTQPDTPLGTPSFMAPEQLSDSSLADARSDLFSLGAVLYELVTARRAFGGTDVPDIYNRVREGSYEPLREIVPDLPERMARTIECALQVDPAHRFADCNALLESWTGIAVPASIDRSLAPQERPRRTWRLASAGLLALAGAAGVTAAAWRLGPERSDPTPDRPVASSERRLTNVAFYNQIARFMLSPDGRSLGWCDTKDSVRLSLDGGSPIDVPGPCPSDWFSDSQRLLVVDRHDAAGFRAVVGDSSDEWSSADWALWNRLPFELSMLGSDGSVEPLPSNLGPEKTWWPELSPDDRRVAFSGKAGPFVYSLDTSSITRLQSLDAADETWAIEWSPSGEYVASIHANIDEAWLQITAADGSSSRRVLTDPRLDVGFPANLWWGWWDRPGRRMGANLAWLEPDRLVYGLTDDRVSPIETTLYVVDDASTATDFAGAAVFERLVGGYIMDLAATPDGRRMIYRRCESHDDIWVLPLDDPESAAQVTHEEWDELPSGWTAAGDLVYASDRKGHQDMHTQPADAVAPTLLSGDPAREWPGDVHGDAVLWWRAETDATGAETGQVLVRAVPGAGEPVPVLAVGPGDYSVRCPLTADRRCIVAKRAARTTEFYWLDPDSGALGPWLQQMSAGPGVTGWDLSPDGNRLAVVTWLPTAAELVIRDIGGGGVVAWPLQRLQPRELAWAPSGEKLYLAAIPLEIERRLHPAHVWSIGLDGAMELLWEAPLRVVSDPTPSPDGKRLAVRVTAFESADLWLLDRQ